MCGTCGARTTLIPSQRARVLSVGKTPSFSFSQVDMYVYICIYVICVRLLFCHTLLFSLDMTAAAFAMRILVAAGLPLYAL